MGLRSPLVGFGTGGPIDSGVVGGGGTRNGTTSIPRSVFPTRPVSKSGSLQTGCSASSGGGSNGNHHAPPGLGNHLRHPAAARGSALLFRPRSRPRSPRSLLFRPGSRPRFLGATAEGTSAACRAVRPQRHPPSALGPGSTLPTSTASSALQRDASAASFSPFGCLHFPVAVRPHR